MGFEKVASHSERMATTYTGRVTTEIPILYTQFAPVRALFVCAESMGLEKVARYFAKISSTCTAPVGRESHTLILELARDTMLRASFVIITL